MTISLTWTWNLGFFQLIPGLPRMLQLRLFCPQKPSHIRPVTASLTLPSPPKHTLEPSPNRSPLKSLSLWDYKKYLNLDTSKSREIIQLWSFISTSTMWQNTPQWREGSVYRSNSACKWRRDDRIGAFPIYNQFSQFSRSVVSDSLRPHGV